MSNADNSNFQSGPFNLWAPAHIRPHESLEDPTVPGAENVEIRLRLGTCRVWSRPISVALVNSVCPSHHRQIGTGPHSLLGPQVSSKVPPMTNERTFFLHHASILFIYSPCLSEKSGCLSLPQFHNKSFCYHQICMENLFSY